MPSSGIRIVVDWGISTLLTVALYGWTAAFPGYNPGNPTRLVAVDRR
jgi:hypothetical protein